MLAAWLLWPVADGASMTTLAYTVAAFYVKEQHHARLVLPSNGHNPDNFLDIQLNYHCLTQKFELKQNLKNNDHG